MPFRASASRPPSGPACGPSLATPDCNHSLGLQPYFGPDDPNGAALLDAIVRTLLPLLERTGVANAAEIGVETLHQRMSEELARAHAVFAFPILVTAWATRTS
jgi:hypothetical protein